MNDCTRIRVSGKQTRIRVQCQGLPGPPGPPGGASDSIIVMQTDDILVRGTPVYVKATARFGLAKGDDRPQTKTVGVSLESTGIGGAATVQTQDIVTLTTAEWDAVTGQVGGLSIGAVYYLSQTTAGMFQTTPPVADPPNPRFNSRIGIAIKATDLNITIRSPWKLS